jgi:hypothetical protein
VARDFIDEVCLVLHDRSSSWQFQLLLRSLSCRQANPNRANGRNQTTACDQPLAKTPQHSYCLTHER